MFFVLKVWLVCHMMGKPKKYGAKGASGHGATGGKKSKQRMHKFDEARFNADMDSALHGNFLSLYLQISYLSLVLPTYPRCNFQVNHIKLISNYVELCPLKRMML